VRLRGSFTRSQALNVGLVACTTSHAALVDEHCDFVEGDWIETLFAYMSRDGVAAVAPILTDEYGVIHSAGLSLMREPHDTGSGHRVSEIGPVGMFAIARECFGVRSHCAVVNVAALKSVGGFSPDYASDLVDFDVACKLHEIGKHAIITPLVTVRLFDELQMSDEDQKLFVSKWGRYIDNDPYTRSDTRARETVEL
jgi:GT2 family glycosyltransferase